jgi:hypothetical protein
MTVENPYAPPEGELKGRGAREEIMHRKVGEHFCRASFFSAGGILLLALIAVPPQSIAEDLAFAGLFFAIARWYWVQGRKLRAELVESGLWQPDLIKACCRKCLRGYLLAGLAILLLGLLAWWWLGF